MNSLGNDTNDVESHHNDVFPPAKKICLDNDQINNSVCNTNTSISDTSLNLGALFSPNCSISIGPIEKHGNISLPSSLNLSDKDSSAVNEYSVSKDSMSDCNSSVLITPNFKEEVEFVWNKSSISRDDYGSPLLQKNNISDIQSTPAFSVDEPLNFMDETCIEDNVVFSKEQKCPLTNSNFIVNVTENQDIHSNTRYVDPKENGVFNKKDLTALKEETGNCTNKFEGTLDFTCKPELVAEGTILYEETLILCQSIINREEVTSDSQTLLKPVETSTGHESNTVDTSISKMSSDKFDINLSSGSLLGGNNNSVYVDESEINFNNKSNCLNSTDMIEEVSGFALDYSCSRSVCMDNSNKTNFASMDSPDQSVVSNKNMSFENTDTIEKQDMNKTNLETNRNKIQRKDQEPVENSNCLCFSKEKNKAEMNDYTSGPGCVSSITNPTFSNKCFTSEELTFLKENLLKVMKLLKNDNYCFEEFKLAPENKRNQLLEKIMNLEYNVINNESFENVSNVKHIPQLSFSEKCDKINSKENMHDLIEKHNFITQQLSKIQTEYRHLSELVCVTENDIQENKKLTSILHDLNILSDGLFTPLSKKKGKYVVNYKNLSNIISSVFQELNGKNILLSREHNEVLMKLECSKEEIKRLNHIVEEYKQGQNNLHCICKIKQNNEVDVLKQNNSSLMETQKIQNTLEVKNSNTNDEIPRLMDKNIELSNEIISLKTIIAKSNHNVELLKNQLEEVKIRYETSKKTLLDVEESYSTLQNSYYQICKEIEMKNSEISEVIANEKQLKHKVEDMAENNALLKQSLTEIQEKHNELEAKCATSNDKVFTLQQDLSDMNDRHNEVLSNFEVYKKTYTSTEVETEVLKNEKNVLENELFSCKAKLETTTDELNQLKCEIEKCSNDCRIVEKQLCDEKQHSIETKNSLESLHEKYAKAITDIENKTTELQNLTKNLTDTEKCNEHLKEELTQVHSYIDDLKVGLSASKEENELLLTKNQNMEAHVEKLNDEISTYKSTVDELTDKSERLIMDLGDKNKNYDVLLETNSDLSNEIISLKTITAESNQNVEHLQNQLEEVKIRYETSQKTLLDVEENYSTLQNSYGQICEELEMKNSEISEVIDNEKQLKNEMEAMEENNALLKQSLTEVQERHNQLKAKFANSNDKVSALQQDLNDVKGKYNEVLSNFDLYKKTYTCTASESEVLKNEKYALENELFSCKTKLETTTYELNQLKCDIEKCSNDCRIVEKQLCDEKQHFIENKNCAECLQENYDETSTDKENKITQLQTFANNLTDMEMCNEQLKGELAQVHSYIDDLKVGLSASKEENELLLTKNQNMEAQVEKLNNEISTYKSTVDELTDKSERLIMDLGDRNKNYDVLLETNSDLSNEIISLKTIIAESNQNVEHLQNQLEEVMIRYETSQKTLLDVEDSYSTLQNSYGQICKELEMNNSEISKVIDNEKQLKNKMETMAENNALLKQSLTEIQEKHNELEAKCATSNDKVFTLQQDLSDMNDRHNEVLSNFEVYKKTYTSTEVETEVLKNEKNALENELFSCKAKLETTTDELNQLKCDIKKCSNDCRIVEKQLCDEKQHSIETKNSLESLHEKYAKAITDIENKTTELQNLAKNLTDTEKCNEHLKEELTQVHSYIDDLKVGLSASKEENELLLTKNQNMEAHVEKLNNEISTYKSTVDELTDKSERLIMDLSDRNKNYDVLLETNSDLSNEIISLKTITAESNQNVELLQNQLEDLKIQYETSQKTLLDVEESYSTLQNSYYQICKEIEMRNSEISEVIDNEKQLKNEMEAMEENNALLKQSLTEIQEKHNELEAKCATSNDKVFTLQQDLSDMNDRHNEVLSNFEVYKKTYTSTEVETEVLKNEKNVLENELFSCKAKLETTTDELNQLKCDIEKCSNDCRIVEKQLCDEKQHSIETKNSLESLHEKYAKAITDIENKTTELQNLAKNLTDTEKCNEHLKEELTQVHSYIDDLKVGLSASKEENELLLTKNQNMEARVGKLNDEISTYKSIVDELTDKSERLIMDLGDRNKNYDVLLETNSDLSNEIISLKTITAESNQNVELLQNQLEDLKIQYETSQKTLLDVEERYSTLQNSYGQICKEMEMKNSEMSILKNDEQKLKAEFEILHTNNSSLDEMLKEIKVKNVLMEEQLLSLNIELLKATEKDDFLKKVWKQILMLKTKYTILSMKLPHEEEVILKDPLHFLSTFVIAVDAIAEEFMALNEKYSQEIVKIFNAEEKIASLNNLVASMTGEVDSKDKQCVKLKEDFSYLSKQHDSLLESNQDLNNRYISLLEKLNGLEGNQDLFKIEIEDLKSELKKKESIITGLTGVNVLYESVIKENENLLSQVSEKKKELESVRCDLEDSEERYITLKLEFDKLMNDFSDLKNKNESLENQYNENMKLYGIEKEQIVAIQKEKEEISERLIKCEKEYKHSLDLVQKSEENILNLDKKYTENISKLNYVLQEKENYESQNLNLQKVNDELRNNALGLNLKIQESENVIKKLMEFEKLYETVCKSNVALEKQLVEYENLKSENDILKSSVSSLVPGNKSFNDTIQLVQEKLQTLKKIEEDLEEEKIKCENLDEECNLLNEDLKYKERVIGDMYKDHSTEMNELKELLKKEETLHKTTLFENSTLKDKIKQLDSEILKWRSTEQIPCSSCVEFKNVLQKLKMDLEERNSKITSMHLKIEESEITNNKRILEYHKKVSSLKEQLESAVNKLEEMKNTKVCYLNAFVQTESLPVHISGQSGIVQSVKIKEQEDKIQKIEKENFVLKRMCQSRLQTIQELKTKLENQTKLQKTNRNILEEVQNHQT